MDGGPECEGLIKKVVGGMGSGLVGWFAFEERVQGQALFPFSRNCLTLGRAVPQGSASPQMSKHQSTENKRHG